LRDTAFAAVRHYMTGVEALLRVNPRQKALISFYGGEPLLAFELLQQVVTLTGSYSAIPIEFSVSTNGLLLTPAIADYLVGHHFNIGVSLDGPREEHDRNRVFRNGRGSFEDAYSNLTALLSRHPTYRRIVLLITYDGNTNIPALRSFLRELPQARVKVLLCNAVARVPGSAAEVDVESELWPGLEQLYREVSRPEVWGEPLVRSLCLHQWFLTVIRPRFVSLGKPGMPYTSSCVPGDKVCVGPDGAFRICEKVPGLPAFGDVETGIDLNAIGQLISRYNRTIQLDCSACPVSRLCSQCFARLWTGKDFARPARTVCSDVVAITRGQFSRFYSVLERQPKLWSELLESADMSVPD
jgi:uncharacterized protein